MNIDFNAAVVLADVGQVDPAGKLHLLGAGWSQTGVGPNGLTPDFAVAVFVTVPWDQCNKELEVSLELVTDDEQAVTVNTPNGEQPIVIKQGVVVSPPAGAPNGSPGQHAMLVGVQGGLPLRPGSWYKWRVRVAGEQEPGWHARFFVVRQPTTPTFGRSS